MVFKPTVLNIVAKSPFKLLQKHMSKSCKSALILSDFLNSSLKSDWSEAKNFLLSISRYESKSDALKIEVCQNLHKGVFLPVSKGQVLSLLMYQDEIANISEDLAGLIYGRKMKFPLSIHSDMVKYLDSSINACFHAEKAIAELSQIIESGFSGSVNDVTESIISDLNNIESSNDKLQIELRRKIFALENDLPPLDVIFLYEIIKKIGNLADCAQKVGVQLIILVSR